MIEKKLIEFLENKFKDTLRYSVDDNVFYLDKIESWFDVAEFIATDKNFKFNYLMCITSYDLGDSKQFGLAYNFNSIELKHCIEIRIEFGEGLEIPSVESIWKTADWYEREAYDMMGVKFANHPDMKRILLPDDWEGYPLRKDYKTPEYYNGMPVPKDKSYWE